MAACVCLLPLATLTRVLCVFGWREVATIQWVTASSQPGNWLILRGWKYVVAIMYTGFYASKTCCCCTWTSKLWSTIMCMEYCVAILCFLVCWNRKWLWNHRRRIKNRKEAQNAALRGQRTALRAFLVRHTFRFRLELLIPGWSVSKTSNSQVRSLYEGSDGSFTLQACALSRDLSKKLIIQVTLWTHASQEQTFKSTSSSSVVLSV